MALFKDPMESKARLIQLINAENAGLVNGDVLDVVSVEYIDHTEPPYRNTRVVFAANDADYSGTREVFYNRIDLSDILKHLEIRIPGSETPRSLEDVIAGVNDVTGLGFTTDDLTSATEAFEAGNSYLLTTPVGTVQSVAFIGEFTVVMEEVAIPFSTLLGTTILDDFNANQFVTVI